MKVGRKYKVKKAKSRRAAPFIGTCIGKEDRYYILQHREGFKECFLKSDFVIGECIAEEI
ncbi:hypothetical protein FYJ27_01650 [Anaerosalibacter bizertensis]|uniref:Uncharacterized protein n=1 Tax=Anaerosalibacter bizertensis TaxID=932217 RepID=A0A844FEQ8_9FIRM|nr:hypothetical protein [Anaerosalibacter bizertensis]MSS42442.1 hypothetical protein [Anaerosalibacter bizertensis]